MTRVSWLLVSLLVLLLGVLWYFLVFAPTSEDIEITRDQTDQTLAEAQTQRNLAQTLRQIRAEAPEAEAQLALARSIIPDDPAIPALFRQLQQASDDAGARLTAISPGAPETIQVGGEGGSSVAAISVTLSLEGTYFQLVDLSRRIEDPLLTPRGLRWDTASITPGEYPTLNATLSGTVYARSGSTLPEPPPEPEPEPDEADDPDAEDETDTDPTDVPPADGDQIEVS